MRHISALVILLASFFSNSAHAFLWIHETHTGSAFGMNHLGMSDVIVSQLNRYAIQWRPGDVVIINHNGVSGQGKITNIF